MRLDRKTLERHFGNVWPTHNHAFTSLLIVCREHFDGDLDEMLILSIIGDRTLVAQRFEGLSYDDFRSGRRNDSRRKVINVQSIADCSGIPRETVRRKVARLIERGWVESGSTEGCWRLSGRRSNWSRPPGQPSSISWPWAARC